MFETELILNPDGSIYHLHLKPEHIAPLIIFVGDPARVGEVSKHFDTIEHQSANREFVAHIGTLRGQRLMVISTGIGTDNIDIVMNELDILVNVDLETRKPKSNITPLSIVRLGTSGSLQAEVKVDSLVVSTIAVGFDNLMTFYDAAPTGEELTLADNLTMYLEHKNDDLLLIPSVFTADKKMLQLFDTEEFVKGVTVTAPGFYAPQGRVLRGKAAEPKLVTMLNLFRQKTLMLTNMEMETSGIYGLARLLGHRALSVSAVLANRIDGTFSTQATTTVERMIVTVLKILVP
ncbi:MAG: nucleoside phosphorylase [Saprospiraceae bacterium]|nr:nucleoside phosphorylase [Saprospiraceae bacterium]